jgi:PEP-CTERM motif
MHVITRSIIGFAMLVSSGGAIATMISGTIIWPEDGVRTEFYQEDIWQIISDITPDTKAEKKLLSKNDKNFVKNASKYQKKIIKLENKAEVRELNKKQANSLLNLEDRLLQLLNSRNLLDSLLLAELNSPSPNNLVPNDQTNNGINDYSSQDSQNDLVFNDMTNSGITEYSSQESQLETSVPEPSTLVLLALGLLCLGVAHGKHACRPWV